MKTSTQFIWSECLGMATLYTGGLSCWLCAGPCGDDSQAVKSVVGSAFTDGNIAKAPHSDKICGACHALMKKESWEDACNRHGHSPYFPVKDGKKPFLSNWMFSSHIFYVGGWVRPDRQAARSALLSPPEPPFVIILAAVGKKHIIFRSSVSYSRENYFVQLDEESIPVNRVEMCSLLDDFERAYSMGLSKDSLLTGNYNQAAVMKIGISEWRQIEDKMKAWRETKPGLMKLAHFCGQKYDIDMPEKPEIQQQTNAEIEKGQASLF